MRLPYNFDENIQKIKQLADDPHESFRDLMLAMPEDEFNRLRWALPSITKSMRSLQEIAKAVYIERSNNYENMVKYAKKRFNAVDIAILELLAHEDESAYYFRGIVSHVREILEEPITEKTIKKSVQLLKRRGLVEVETGLFDEDGFTAGSGYQCVYHKRDVIEQIINNYKDEQLELSGLQQ